MMLKLPANRLLFSKKMSLSLAAKNKNYQL
jgi:hypothetical protein